MIGSKVKSVTPTVNVSGGRGAVSTGVSVAVAAGFAAAFGGGLFTTTTVKPLNSNIFFKNSLQVTDLNNDGFGEVWLMYKTACRSDVSSSDMKIIMYQKQQKFAMRGQNKVQVSEKEFSGGDYKFDKGFTDGPNEFRVFAKSMWDKNLMPTKGD